MSVKKIGNDCEKMLCKLLQEKGYWCHIFEYSKNGQPCDIVAIKGNVALLIDAKHCSTDSFSFDRIEPNQRSCFNYAHNVCNVRYTGFAIYFEKDDVWKWLPFDRLDVLESQRKSAPKTSLVDLEMIL